MAFVLCTYDIIHKQRIESGGSFTFEIKIASGALANSIFGTFNHIFF